MWETKFTSNQEEAQILDLFIPLHVIQTSKPLHLMWRGHWNLALCIFLTTDQFKVFVKLAIEPRKTGCKKTRILCNSEGMRRPYCEQEDVTACWQEEKSQGRRPKHSVERNQRPVLKCTSLHQRSFPRLIGLRTSRYQTLTLAFPMEHLLMHVNSNYQSLHTRLHPGEGVL